MDIASNIFAHIGTTFLQASFFLLFGLCITGLFKAFVAAAWIKKHLGHGKVKPVLWATLWGIPVPLCSCGVIPAAMILRKEGATKGATLSFLISTPETDIDSIAISYALLDPLMTVFRVIAGFMMAITAGLTESFFDKGDPVSGEKHQTKDSCCREDIVQTATLPNRIRQGMNYAFGELLEDIAPWLLFGLTTAGIIAYAVPASFIEQYFSNTWVSMLVMLAVGIPLYVCASASTPIAAALILKGLSPGAALVFLLSGPATNPATIMTVAKFLGKRALAIYLTSIIVCSLFFGAVLNWIYDYYQIDIQVIAGHAGHALPDLVQSGSAVILLILIFNAIMKKHVIRHA